MPSIKSYDVYIFDCDGVILDSNQLKIKAMHNVLHSFGFKESEVKSCIGYFRNNFGKSRFHHVKIFIENYLSLASSMNKITLEENILERFSEQCTSLYTIADITPHFLDFLSNLSGKKYIASGSAQDELRVIFDKRNLTQYFKGIYGSPTEKVKNIEYILQTEGTNNAIMFGDAFSDLMASLENKIDFIAYRSYSNIPEKLTAEARKHSFPVIDRWTELL